MMVSAALGSISHKNGASDRSPNRMTLCLMCFSKALLTRENPNILWYHPVKTAD